MAAKQLSVVKELYDMTECSICTEVFTDPRVLPCIHTFCLKCLVNYGKDGQPGDDMPCPLCRKEFTIPDDGLSGMQKNFFMEKLLITRKLSAAEETGSILCDVCSSDEARSSEATSSARPATKRCYQCQQNFCDHCSQSHTKIKAAANHVTLEIGKELQKEEIALRLPATCETHKDKEIELFCLECELAICMMCFVKSHKTHDCSDIEEVSIDRRKQVKNDIRKITKLLKKIGGVLPRFEKEKNGLVNRLADIEGKINTAADKVIAAVQRDRQKLLSEVESIKMKRVKQLEIVKQEVEQHLASVESLKQYSELLLSSGTACDVTRSANSLHSRAEELMMFDVISHVDSSLPSLNVNFTSSSPPCVENLVGTIAEEETTSGAPTVTHVIPEDAGVTGVTSLGDDVFVVRFQSQQVDVYDAVTFTLQRRLSVPGLGGYSYGLAACASNKCLYASDFSNARVHRVELSGRNAVTKWPVGREPVGLIVNSAKNVLVVSQGERKLQEFTTHGALLQTIQLQSGIKYPEQVVKLSNGQFMISHIGTHHGVCLLDVKGAVVGSYGGTPGSDLTEICVPAGLAVDENENIIVADRFNNRLLVLDRLLINAHEMSVDVDGGLKNPSSLWYDKSRVRLYIGERSWRQVGRLIIIDNLKNFTASQV